MKTTLSIRTILRTQWTDFYGWKRSEYAWLAVAVASILGISLVMGSGMIEVVSALTGIIGAILVARAKLSSYVWGAVATGTYAWIAFSYQLFGEAILYTLLFLPMQFIGYAMWLKAAKRGQDNTVEVVRRSLTNKQRVLVVLATAGAIALYASLIGLLRGAEPGLDSATAILSVLATLLMMLRYGEQWLVWIVVNCVAIVLWVLMVLQHQDQGWAVLAMWVLYLLNSVYGWWKWRRTLQKDEGAA